MMPLLHLRLMIFLLQLHLMMLLHLHLMMPSLVFCPMMLWLWLRLMMPLTLPCLPWPYGLAAAAFASSCPVCLLLPCEPFHDVLQQPHPLPAPSEASQDTVFGAQRLLGPEAARLLEQLLLLLVRLPPSGFCQQAIS